MNEGNSIQKWLEKLQRESWQLELIVSGFTIFLLLQVATELPEVFPTFNMHTDFSPFIRTILVTFIAGGLFSVYALVSILILHIFLRGFWIASIGLRSVQKDVEFDKLKYSNYFTEKLKPRVQSLDRLIYNVDNLCSVLFAFAYLVAFMFLSIALWVMFINGISLILQIGAEYFEGYILGSILDVLNTVFFTTMIFSTAIYFIDTVTLGFFKKFEFFSKIYYPIYRWMGWITLAFIYRSIYYSLISRFSKNKIRILLFAFMFLIAMIPFNRISFYKYFPDINSDSKSINRSRYDSIRNEKDKIWSASIPSEVISDTYFPLFIRYNIKNNEVLDSLCTDYTPTKQSLLVTGVFNNGGLNDPYYAEEDSDKLLACLSRLYSVQINDSTYQDLDYYFYSHGLADEKGLRTMINTEDLPKGKNIIKLSKYQFDKEKKLVLKKYDQFPFWLE